MCSHVTIFGLWPQNHKQEKELIRDDLRLETRKKLGLFAPAVNFQAIRVTWIQPNPGQFSERTSADSHN